MYSSKAQGGVTTVLRENALRGTDCILLVHTYVLVVCIEDMVLRREKVCMAEPRIPSNLLMKKRELWEGRETSHSHLQYRERSV